jgi:AcrR family transcriptional regulator
MNVHSESLPVKSAADEKRRQILDAALALITENGFHGAGMAALAKLAGVPVGTMYRYFPSKEALIHDLYREIKQQMHRQMLRDFDPAQPIRERFFALWENLFDYYLANPQSFSFLEQYGSSPFLRDLKSSLRAATPQALRDFFEEGYRGQILKPLPPELLYALLNGPIVALCNTIRNAAAPLSPERRREVMLACWDAVKI